MRIILFAILLGTVTLAAPLKADMKDVYERVWNEDILKHAEIANQVMRGELLYKSEGAYLYGTLYYYARDLIVYFCFYAKNEHIQSPVALCYNQLDEAKRKYPAKFEDLKPYLRLPALILKHHSERQIAEKAFKGTTWTFHAVETGVYMCSVQGGDLLVCKANTDATDLNLD